MLGYNLAGYLIFAFVTSITPGPNNFLLFSYGKNYGFKDSGKLMAGILAGFFVMLLATGYGIAEIITQNPVAELILKVLGSAWLLYLAFVLSKLGSEITSDNAAKIGFGKGFLMQFINFKAWIMAISGASAFMPTYANIHLKVFVFAILFALVGIPCMISWVFLGDTISRILKSERANRMLGYTLFILMIISIVMIWI